MVKLALVSMKTSKPVYGTNGARMVVNKKTVGKLYWTYDPQSKTLTVEDVNVSAKHRKKGYAKAGIKTLIKDHPLAIKVKTTPFRKTNKACIALFETLGFEFYTTKDGQRVGVLGKNAKKVKPDQQLLFHMFVATQFIVLMDHPLQNNQSKYSWFKSAIPSTLRTFASKAIDIFHAPPKLKSRDDLYRFHLHAMKSTVLQWEKDGVFEKNRDTLNKIYELAYTYTTMNPLDHGPIPYRNRVSKATKLIDLLHM